MFSRIGTVLSFLELGQFWFFLICDSSVFYRIGTVLCFLNWDSSLVLLNLDRFSRSCLFPSFVQISKRGKFWVLSKREIPLRNLMRVAVTARSKVSVSHFFTYHIILISSHITSH